MNPNNNNKLQYRMYGLVPFNLAPIQQGIQFGHGVVEYMLKFPPDLKIYNTTKQWAESDKTFIILDGGSTGTQSNLDNGLPHGDMNRHLLTLKKNNVQFATFYEPDLGNQLTAIVFLVDNRVYDNLELNEFDLGPHESWYGLIGGETNLFLHKWLQQFKLA